MSLATLTPPVPDSSHSAPLTDEHCHLLAAANRRFQKIRRAGKVASFNGWVTTVFAVCSLPFAFFSVSGFLVAAGLVYVAHNEFRGRRQMLDCNPRGAIRLGWNQLIFLAIITAYCIWMLVEALAGPSPLAAELAAKPELREALGSFEEFEPLYRLIVMATYGGIIVLSLAFQGLTAWYYFSRARLVSEFRRETPEWVLAVQQTLTER